MLGTGVPETGQAWATGSSHQRSGLTIGSLKLHAHAPKDVAPEVQPWHSGFLSLESLTGVTHSPLRSVARGKEVTRRTSQA